MLDSADFEFACPVSGFRPGLLCRCLGINYQARVHNEC
jgi:hypothetical protein